MDQSVSKQSKVHGAIYMAKVVKEEVGEGKEPTVCHLAIDLRKNQLFISPYDLPFLSGAGEDKGVDANELPHNSISVVENCSCLMHLLLSDPLSDRD